MSTEFIVDPICKRCNKPIEANELRFYSYQAGMRGDYHWACYKAQVKESNEQGQRAILSTGATRTMLRPSPVDEISSMRNIVYADR